MRKEFMVERQGRSFCLYAGLLDLAHQQGLKSIKTELVQIPNEANNRVAISVATIVLEKEGVERVYTGIGDAAPNNVAPAMVTCLIRMSETRAKARALRDAVNVGVAAFEEMGEEDAYDGAPERGYATGRSSRQPARAQSTTSAPRQARADVNINDPITDAQKEAIRSLCRRHNVEPDDVAKDKYGVSLDNLTTGQASAVIIGLNQPRVA